MPSNDGSQFALYSLGIAANNREPDSLEISVTPIEKMQFLDGEIVSLPYDNEVAGTEEEGSDFTAKVTTDVAIRATWLKGGGNRATPEDIRRGQRVFIYKFADRNEYLWQYAGLDDDKFTTQTVVIRISATDDETADRTDPANSYYLEVCTRTGKITLQTSKANGEFSSYAVQLDARRGFFIITDELENYISLDSANTVITLYNSDGTYITLDKETIQAFANDFIQMKATNKIGAEAKLIEMICQQLQVKSDKNTFTTPETEFSGNVTIGGTLSQKGSGTFDGGVTFTKPIQANGITSSAKIQGPTGSI